MPFGYVSPEQVMRDRADYARKGIARGRPVLILTYSDGILFATENASTALHKISEVYDRIGFAAVGKYNEFESLRQAGVRIADLRGYQYDRSDVTARMLATTYAQLLGTVFSGAGEKPFEVEITLAEVGDDPAQDSLYRLTYDGTVADEKGVVVMGASADEVAASLRGAHDSSMTVSAALQLAVHALSGANSQAAGLGPAQLEVAVLDRNKGRRKFHRLGRPQLDRLLSG